MVLINLSIIMKMNHTLGSHLLLDVRSNKIISIPVESLQEMFTTIFSRQLHICWEELETSIHKKSLSLFCMGLEKLILSGLHTHFQ